MVFSIIDRKSNRHGSGGKVGSCAQTSAVTWESPERVTAEPDPAVEFEAAYYDKMLVPAKAAGVE